MVDCICVYKCVHLHMCVLKREVEAELIRNQCLCFQMKGSGGGGVGAGA